MELCKIRWEVPPSSYSITNLFAEQKLDMSYVADYLNLPYGVIGRMTVAVQYAHPEDYTHEPPFCMERLIARAYKQVLTYAKLDMLAKQIKAKL